MDSEKDVGNEDPEVVQIPGGSLLYFQFWSIPDSVKKSNVSHSEGFPS